MSPSFVDASGMSPSASGTVIKGWLVACSLGLSHFSLRSASFSQNPVPPTPLLTGDSVPGHFS